jgi:hypothetical protein
VQGKYTWGVTGTVYEGDYCEGKKIGTGKISYPNNSVYEGEWLTASRVRVPGRIVLRN